MQYIKKNKQSQVIFKEDQSITVKAVSQDAIEITVEERQPKDKKTIVWRKILRRLVENILEEVCLRLYSAIIEGRGEEMVHTVNLLFDKVTDALFNEDFINSDWSDIYYIYVLLVAMRLYPLCKQLLGLLRLILLHNE